MHRFVIFIPLCAALAFTQTGTELIGVVFNKENMDAILGASSSGSHAFASSLANGLGLGAMSVGQIGAAVVAALVYCICIGYSSAKMLGAASFGPVSHAFILLAGCLAGPALHARMIGQFAPKSLWMPALVMVGASLVLLALCAVAKLWLDDDAGQTAPAGGRVAGIAARKPR